MRTLLCLLTACAGAPAVTDDTDDSEPASTWPDRIRFDVVAGDAPARCGVPLGALGRASTAADLVELRFFVHDLVLSGGGDEAELAFDATPFQSGTLALLDFEDATGACTSGDARTNHAVEVYVPDGAWDTLTFTLGVPFSDNHVAPAEAGVPLDAPGLARTRRDGWTFLAADVLPAGGSIWPTRVASGGCDGELPTDPPTACGRPGRATVTLPFDPFAGDVVTLDLAVLLGGVDLTADAGGPPGCLGDVADTHECGPVYDALGMSFVAGTCVADCEGQRAFTRTPGSGLP